MWIDDGQPMNKILRIAIIIKPSHFLCGKINVTHIHKCIEHKIIVYYWYIANKVFQVINKFTMK